MEEGSIETDGKIQNNACVPDLEWSPIYIAAAAAGVECPRTGNWKWTPHK